MARAEVRFDHVPHLASVSGVWVSGVEVCVRGSRHGLMVRDTGSARSVRHLALQLEARELADHTDSARKRLSRISSHALKHAGCQEWTGCESSVADPVHNQSLLQKTRPFGGGFIN
jgi:hypothetical protein